MPALRDLQRAFRAALLGGQEGALAEHILEDGLSADERFAVYRNNVVSSLTAVLRDTFPVVCRLVDERFFGYAAHAFLCAHPPVRACLHEYGALFPDFLAGFPPCQHLVYLRDVARLEWLMHEAGTAPAATPLSPQALTDIRPDDTPRLILSLHPSIGHVASPWPIDRIWHANRARGVADAAHDEPIDLDTGSVAIEVYRNGQDVMMRAHPLAVFAFRSALREGKTLGAAAEAALMVEASFDLKGALAELFRDDTVVALALAPKQTAP
jgi:hypothetical protein